MATTQQEQPEARRRNPRGQGDRLREEIISAASELIAESGDADRLSLRAVAKKIGIAAPSIYRHFPDAEHLKMAVVQRNFATFAAARARASAKSPIRPRRCWPDCAPTASSPWTTRARTGSCSATRRPPDPDRPSGGPAAIQALAASIARCRDAGAALAFDDPARLAAQVWAALHGLVLLRMNLPDFPWPAPLEEMADQAVARLIILRESPHVPRQ